MRNYPMNTLAENVARQLSELGRLQQERSEALQRKNEAEHEYHRIENEILCHGQIPRCYSCRCEELQPRDSERLAREKGEKHIHNIRTLKCWRCEEEVSLCSKCRDCTHEICACGSRSVYLTDNDD